MIYAYIRVSTDTQTVTNQKYEILQFIDEKKFILINGLKNLSAVLKN